MAFPFIATIITIPMDIIMGRKADTTAGDIRRHGEGRKYMEITGKDTAAAEELDAVVSVPPSVRRATVLVFNLEMES